MDIKEICRKAWNAGYESGQWSDETEPFDEWWEDEMAKAIENEPDFIQKAKDYNPDPEHFTES